MLTSSHLLKEILSCDSGMIENDIMGRKFLEEFYIFVRNFIALEKIAQGINYCFKSRT